MTAATHAAQPPRADRARLDIPRIRFWSWLGLESVLWGLLISHIAKWAGNFSYFSGVQVRYSVGYGDGTWTVWYLKDFWDRLVVHVQNGLPGEVAVLCGLAAAVAAWLLLRKLPARRLAWRLLLVLLAVAIGTAAALATARQLAGWHVHWFPSQQEPAWWVTGRHRIRDVGIALAATIAVVLMYSKPKHPADDVVPLKVYVRSVPLALAAALVPIAALSVLAWKLPWLTSHGLHLPGRYGAAAAEVNGFVAAGTWITVLMGVLGGIVAKLLMSRVADDIQWFFAERSAGRIRSNSGLNQLRGSRNIGTPAHRKRVEWLLEHRPDLPGRNPWLVRGLLVAGFFVLAYAGAGCWLVLFSHIVH